LIDATPAVPDDLLADLWFITFAKEPEAVDRWEALAHVPTSLAFVAAENSAAWRAKLTGDNDFMALAYDFARNYLIVTALSGVRGTRRVISFPSRSSALIRPRDAALTTMVGFGDGSGRASGSSAYAQSASS
jgi:hypothetical protein